MKVTQTATATTINRPTSPATSFTWATQPKIWEDATAEAQTGDIIRKPFCPIARVVGKEVLKDGRVCLVVTFPNCHDRHIEEWVLPAVEVEEAPIVTAAPAPAKTAATAIGTETDSPPNRGDNGRGRVEPIAPKKLNLSLVAVKRISSDIPVCNFDPNELEIGGVESGDRRVCGSPGGGARCQRIQSYQRPLSVPRRSSGPEAKSEGGRNNTSDRT